MKLSNKFQSKIIIFYKQIKEYFVLVSNKKSCKSSQNKWAKSLLQSLFMFYNNNKENWLEVLTALIGLLSRKWTPLE